MIERLIIATLNKTLDVKFYYGAQNFFTNSTLSERVF